jgi:SAM-dependent methyltransferase
MSEPEELRERMLDGWEQAARGWRRGADRVRDTGMPVSAWMVEHLELQPGERVLELAAGPGDTGFMAAELVRPGGRLISSDGSEQMLAIARDRAAAQGVDNVEFKQLQLEWIDLETASVDAILCRWALMLLVDPAAALTECRRVLRPGGRITLAVWDVAERNPWATIPSAALRAVGHGSAADPDGPGRFALAAPGRLEALLYEAGFVDVVVDAVEIVHDHDDAEAFLDETLELSRLFARAWTELDDERQAALMTELAARVKPFTGDDGRLMLPGSSLVARAEA